MSDMLKEGRVILLYKKEREQLGYTTANYWPITMFSVLFKVMTRFMNKRLTKVVNSTNGSRKLFPLPPCWAYQTRHVYPHQPSSAWPSLLLLPRPILQHEYIYLSDIWTEITKQLVLLSTPVNLSFIILVITLKSTENSVIGRYLAGSKLSPFFLIQ